MQRNFFGPARLALGLCLPWLARTRKRRFEQDAKIPFREKKG
jgi:hypothetical protein